MDYKKYKKTEDLNFKLLSKLGVLTRLKYVFQIDNSPDFDLSYYEKGSMQTYFFSHETAFPANLSFILKMEIIDKDIFTYDDLERLSTAHNVEINPDDFGQFLTVILQSDEELQGCGTSLDDFHLHAFGPVKVNNSTKSITFNGGYNATYSGIQPDYWNLYAICEVLGFKDNVTKQHLYLNLLAEGYSLMVRGDFILSFFILYSSFECYVNTKLNANDEAGRLNDKVKNLFSQTFSEEDLIKHEIYSSMIGEFKYYTKLRDAIAHGRERLHISDEDVKSLMRFVLTTIVVISKKINNFEKLSKLLEKYNHHPFSSN